MARTPLLLLLMIVLFGSVLRTYDISRVPTELIVDELDLYNSVHSIVTTGHDIDGSLEPFLYSRYTRNPPIYGIAAYASSLVFGRTPFGLRLPAVLFGLCSIVLIYGIAFELTRRRAIALVAALVQAISPLFIQFSRVAWEPASELPFLLGGLYVLVRAFSRVAPEKPPSSRALALAAVLLGLTCYTYMSGWTYAVILGGAIVLFNAWRVHEADAWPRVAAATLLWIVLAAPALWTVFFDPLTSSKVARIGTFSHGATPYAVRAFARNYLAHFRWSYLVTTGDPISGITWRYLNGFGAFYGWIVGLAVLGLFAIRRYAAARWMVFWVLLWLLAYPLGGALTNEGAPNAPRTLAGAPVFCILAGIGFACVSDLAGSIGSRRLRLVATAAVRGLLGIGTAASVGLFFWYYSTWYVHVNSNAWDSGTRALFTAIRAHSGSYRRVCFGVRPEIYQVDTYIRFYLDGVKLTTLETLGDPACHLPGTMLATDSNQMVVPPGFTVLDAIVDVDDQPFAVLAGRP